MMLYYGEGEDGRVLFLTSVTLATGGRGGEKLKRKKNIKMKNNELLL
jgi:hypothetical protein